MSLGLIGAIRLLRFPSPVPDVSFPPTFANPSIIMEVQCQETVPGLNSVLEKLQKAAELELGTLPPYLTAIFSLMPGSNREVAGIIRSVAMEEMLHLALVANVITALGSGVRLGASNIPKYPLRLEFKGQSFRDREFDVDLAPFSRGTLDTFLKIELPASRLDDARLLLHAAELVVPGLTLGEFYQGIQKDLERLVGQYGEARVFSGNPAHQVSKEFYWGGGGTTLRVIGLESAKTALELIIEQGEGSSGGLDDGDAPDFGQPAEVAHYFRFKEIREGRRYAPGDVPSKPPTGPALAVDYDRVFPIRRNCRAADLAADPALSALNTRFNHSYSLMLRQLEQGFGGNPRVLYTAIMNGMHGLLPIASEMVQMPIQGDPEGRHGTPTFEWVDPEIPV